MNRTIYTVTSRNSIDQEFIMVGSYTSRGQALDACVKYILRRMKFRKDLVWMMAHNRLHPEAAEFFTMERCPNAVNASCTVLKQSKRKKFREYLRDVLGGNGYYYVQEMKDVFYFDVDENDLIESEVNA